MAWQSDFLGQIDMQLDVLEDESEHDGWYFLTPKPSIFTSQINQQVGPRFISTMNSIGWVAPLNPNHATVMAGLLFYSLTDRFSCLVAAAAALGDPKSGAHEPLVLTPVCLLPSGTGCHPPARAVGALLQGPAPPHPQVDAGRFHTRELRISGGSSVSG